MKLDICLPSEIVGQVSYIWILPKLDDHCQSCRRKGGKGGNMESWTTKKWIIIRKDIRFQVKISHFS